MHFIVSNTSMDVVSTLCSDFPQSPDVTMILRSATANQEGICLISMACTSIRPSCFHKSSWFSACGSSIFPGFWWPRLCMVSKLDLLKARLFKAPKHFEEPCVLEGNYATSTFGLMVSCLTFATVIVVASFCTYNMLD